MGAFSENFYSHAPCGARPKSVQHNVNLLINFYSHAPCGARLLNQQLNLLIALAFLLTRPLRGATIARPPPDTSRHISTHTPLAGRDKLNQLVPGLNLISTHTPLAGRDADDFWKLIGFSNFYSHAPCGARPTKLFLILFNQISTHTPLAGRDLNILRLVNSVEFLLTRPLRGATNTSLFDLPIVSISTHTPLAGRDCSENPNSINIGQYFYSHAPCGARLLAREQIIKF